MPARFKRNIWSGSYAPNVRLLGRAIALLIRLLEQTITIERIGWEHWAAARADTNGPGSTLFVIWHAEQVAAMMPLKERGVAAMASLSKDGDIVSATMECLGYRLVRGSSSRGGARSLLEMARLMQTESCDGAITVDGPRGPAHRAKPGAALLAQKTGVPIIALSASTSRGKRFASWDRFEVPLPFSHVLFILGKPFFIDPKCPLDEGTSLIEKQLSIVENTAAKRGMIC
ncbi:MAG: lysophospholipid acyltransferase family protein [Candidatus Riflebacteria bacterium]|nr:lysophospholipid acyltransferase family protein [Candidatus Riflebacteria bacterium]